jgi:glucoamylase
MRLVLAVLLAAVFASPALAAPGARSTWAPADKHGFGTARQLGSPVWFTLRQASLSEVYYPDLDTPSFRGLQFAVRRRTVDREVVDDDPAHIERRGARPGGAGARLADVQADHRDVALEADQDVVHGPGAASVLADVKFDQDAPAAAALRARGSGGERHPQRRPWARDGRVGRPRPARWRRTPGFASRRGTAARRAIRGSICRITGVRLGRGHAGRRGAGRVDRAGRRASSDEARDRLRARRRRCGRHGTGFAPATPRATTPRLAFVPRVAEAPAASVGRNIRLYQQSLMVLAASEYKLNRGASVAAPNMPWVWARHAREPCRRPLRPVPLVWPRDFFHVVTARRRPRLRRGGARFDYLWKVQKPDGSW